MFGVLSLPIRVTIVALRSNSSVNETRELRKQTFSSTHSTQGVQGVSVYLDDIIVTGKDPEEHLNHLEKVLLRLKEAGFRINWKSASLRLVR